MIDGRVLTAVLASLAAVAASIGGGGLSADQVKESTISAPGEFSFEDVMPDSVDSLQRFFENPEPEKQVRAVLVSDRLREEMLHVSSAKVSASNFSSLKISGNKLDSDEDIVLYGFNGEIYPGNGTELSGMSDSILTSGVNVSGGINVQEKMETEDLSIEGVEKSRLELYASGEIESEGSSTEIKGARRISIDSFSGDIEVFPGNSTIVMDGKVNRLESGDFSFGG